MSVVHGPLGGGVSKTLSRGSQGKNYFPNNAKTVLALHCVAICTDGGKAMVGRVVAPNYIWGHCGLHTLLA